MKQIDLGPSEYKTEPRPREPILGAGWPFGAAVLVTILIASVTRDASFPVYALGAIAGAIFGGVVQQFYR